MVYADINVGILYMFAVGGLGVYGVIFWMIRVLKARQGNGLIGLLQRMTATMLMQSSLRLIRVARWYAIRSSL